MRNWRKSVAAFVMLGVFAAPLWADVVPARKAKADRDAVKVEERLVSLGAGGAEAKTSAGSLTPSELRYFAADPTRCHSVAQQDMFAGQTVNMWWESIVGAGMLAAGFGITYYMIHNNE